MKILMVTNDKHVGTDLEETDFGVFKNEVHRGWLYSQMPECPEMERHWFWTLIEAIENEVQSASDIQYHPDLLVFNHGRILFRGTQEDIKTYVLKHYLRNGDEER